MLEYLFSRVWNNFFARIGLISAVVVIAFATIFAARNSLYLKFSRIFSCPDWSDVSQHSSRPFAFAESEDKARALVEQAKHEFYDLARDLIHTSAGEGEAILLLFNGLFANCGDRVVSIELSSQTKALGDLAFASTVAAQLKRHLRDTEKKVLQIHAKRVEAALQKKPDYLPAIDLAQEIFRATCSLRETPPLLSRALDYREYFLQKQLYDSDNGKLFEKSPEIFHAKSRESITGDKFYRELTLRYFEATRFRTPHDPAQLQNLRNSYAIAANPRTLTALIQGLLAEARENTPAIAKKSHYELYALDFPGIADRSDYLYALAESAMRAGELGRAETIAKNALRSGKVKDPTEIQSLERLKFHTDLLRNESENISRF